VFCKIKSSTCFVYYVGRAGLRGRPPGAPTYKERYYVTKIISNMVLLNSGFSHAKEFLRKLSPVWARALKNGYQPCSLPKKV
jgi:hypothetical protein